MLFGRKNEQKNIQVTLANNTDFNPPAKHYAES